MRQDGRAGFFVLQMWQLGKASWRSGQLRKMSQKCEDLESRVPGSGNSKTIHEDQKEGQCGWRTGRKEETSSFVLSGQIR